MQLNPARGRKLHPLPLGRGSGIGRFMQLNPARGRKQEVVELIMAAKPHAVYAAQPREGTETNTALMIASHGLLGLCSSTPRGDGNSWV